MSSSQSDLSNSGYGFDFVVATTQAAINATMKAFLSAGTTPVVNICYVADKNGNPTQIDYDMLKKNANGSDPFAVPADADPTTDTDLRNLMGARFMVGFRAQIGLPPGYAPTAIPDIVTLGENGTSVTFNLMCSQFQVVQLVPGGGYNPPTWMNQSQPSGNAWLFTSIVNLLLFGVDESAYGKLPPAVQQGIANLGADAFSVQQLLFDLDNAALQSIPVISGVQPGTTLYTVLQTDFLGVYFQAMKAQGSPVLGCTITQAPADPSPLVLSSLRLSSSPLLNADGSPISSPTPAQQQLGTLCYSCEANNNPPIAPRTFGWNWVEPSDDCHGVISINRNTFAKYFQQQLTPFVSQNCYLPYVRVWLSGFLDTTVNWQWNMTRYQSPTVTLPESGSTVLQYSWSNYQHDQSGVDGDMGQMTLSTSMDCTVDFVGDTVVITQHLVVYLYLRYLATGAGGNVIDKKITDTYTLSVTPSGQLTAGAPASVIVDNSENPSANPFLNWFADIDSIIASVQSWLGAYYGTNITDFPLSPLTNFIFPGGDTFLFKNVAFSDNQDLVGQITYADPTSVYLATPDMFVGGPAGRGRMVTKRPRLLGQGAALPEALEA